MEKKQSMDLLYHQFKRALLIYDETGSRYARIRARELLADLRDWVEDLDSTLRQEGGLVGRYGNDVEQRETDEHQTL